ncbi:MAG TPA: tRNA threonylcarbamoyladenosine dehydratase [Acholeplasmataceae bacterium]|jgi:tRNA A37 threonylcarbamoyladenosine dehydratase|nr:tRNA threonylcarbamoyladenosine dehydratase [Acholeplasmataceae bacterium]
MKFQRLTYLFGTEGLDKLSKAKVAIVGLGGVGGTAAISLVRSGIGNIIICDFDIIEESNINRQIVANSFNIGMYKTDCLEKLIHEINPACQIKKLTQKVDEKLFDEKPQFVIDAIDDVPSKISLIKMCIKENIPFISSMGAAKKVDPQKVEITTLKKTSYDPIARILRREFKNHDFPVVSSTEEALIRDLGSYMPVTSTFGLLLSDYCIKEILKKGKE